MSSSMFRRRALAHLSSPDRLDDAIEVTNTRAWFALAAVGILLAAAITWSVVARIPTIVRADGYLIHSSGVHTVQAPAAGRVQEILVQAGAAIVAEQPVVRIMRAAGQVDVVKASAAGQVLDLRVAVGNEVNRGSVLLSYERPDEPLEARLYLPPDSARRVQTGMMVQLSPASARPDDAAILLGEVVAVGSFPATIAGIQRVLGSEDLARALVANGLPVEVRVMLLAGAADGQYRWRGAEPSPGELAALQGGTPLTAEIIAAEQRPIALVLGQAQR